MIIYKKKPNGMATDLTPWPYKKIPEGYLKACDGDRIPDEYDRTKLEDGIIELDSEDYKNSVRIKNQQKEIIRLANEARYHFDTVTRYPDKEGKWAAWLNKLFEIYDSGVLQELPEKPY